MPVCQWCKKTFRSNKSLEKHEKTCEWKDKILAWQKKVDENRDKTFWFVDTNKYTIYPCKLNRDSYQTITFIKDDGSMCNWSIYTKEDYLFDNKSDAEAKLNYIKKIYLETFKHVPFLSLNILEEHLDELIYIENKINEALKSYENFEGIDFCDVHAGGIQIRGHHKQIKGYTYGDQPTLNYDFSNIEECIQEFINMWKYYDTPEKVKNELDFIADGEKYGWD